MLDLPISTLLRSRNLIFMFWHFGKSTVGACPTHVGAHCRHKSGSHSRPAARQGHDLVLQPDLQLQPGNLHKAAYLVNADQLT